MKAYVNPDLCIGCGLCASIEPQVFRMNEEGLAESYSEASEDMRASVNEAIDGCPVAAIEEVE